MQVPTMPGYDPDFYGHDLSGAGPLGASAPRRANGIGDAAADAIGKIAQSFATGAPATTSVDYAYKCGQGTHLYRCYAIGKFSHAILVGLQHQVNRLSGKKVLATDGILGPATMGAFAAVAPAALAQAGISFLATPTSLDELAANAPQMRTALTAAADQKVGPESLKTQLNDMLGAMKSAVSSTADVLAEDKAAGRIPAGFSQNQVRMSQGVLGQIANTFGPSAANAANEIDIAPQAGLTRETKIMIGVGVGFTVVAAGVITAIAVSHRRQSKRLRRA